MACSDNVFLQNFFPDCETWPRCQTKWVVLTKTSTNRPHLNKIETMPPKAKQQQKHQRKREKRWLSGNTFKQLPAQNGKHVNQCIVCKKVYINNSDSSTLLTHSHIKCYLIDQGNRKQSHFISTCKILGSRTVHIPRSAQDAATPKKLKMFLIVGAGLLFLIVKTKTFLS